MPQLLADNHSAELFEHLDDPDQNADFFKELISKPLKDASNLVSWPVPIGCQLLRIESDTPSTLCELVLIDNENKCILYFNRVDEVELSLPLNGKPVTQVMIWRQRVGSGRNRSHGLVESIFFNLLIPQYSIVVSDSEQTRDGKSMWLNLLGTAIERPNLSAATFDGETSKLEAIEDNRQLQLRSKWLWGTEKIHAERLAVINSNK